MMDNASNNDTLMDALEIRCLGNGIEFSALEACMRCMPHTIHLAAIKVLFYGFYFRDLYSYLFNLLAARSDRGDVKVGCCPGKPGHQLSR